MSLLDFVVDTARCVACDACVRDCPRGIIRREGPVPAIPASLEMDCIGCQHCLAVCPTGAVSIFGLKPEDSLPLAGALPSREQMRAFARGRRSVRQYKDENVDRALLGALLADLVHAPTGCNDRDLLFTVVDDREELRRLLEKVVAAIEARAKADADFPAFLSDAAAAYRADGTDEFFRAAPHLLVVSPGDKATCGREDAVLALAYFELLAQSAGLGTVWCGYLKIIADAVPEIRALLGLAPDAYFYAMLFGVPKVRYARTVQRDGDVKLRRLTVQA